MKFNILKCDSFEKISTFKNSEEYVLLENFRDIVICCKKIEKAVKAEIEYFIGPATYNYKKEIKYLDGFFGFYIKLKDFTDYKKMEIFHSR